MTRYGVLVLPEGETGYGHVYGPCASLEGAARLRARVAAAMTPDDTVSVVTIYGVREFNG